MSDFDAIYNSTKPVPKASPSGRQVGIVPPGLRDYKPGTYKVVDLAEAQSNMVARIKGNMEKIAGGVDDESNKELTAPEPTLEQAAKLERHVDDTKDNFDLTDDDNTEEDTSSTAVLKEVAKVLRELRSDNKADSRGDHGDPGPNMSNPYSNKEIGQYGHYAQTYTITMEIRQEHQDGAFSSIMTVGMPVSHILQNSSSVTLISPVTSNQYTFQPTAGSDIILNGKDLNNLHVFYPGTSFVLDEYKISGMCFVKAK